MREDYLKKHGYREHHFEINCWASPEEPGEYQYDRWSALHHLLKQQGFAQALEAINADNGDDELDAWLAYELENGVPERRVRYYGTYSASGNVVNWSADVLFAMDLISNAYGELPSDLVIDWPNTARNILTDYTDIELPDGRKAYFR